MVRSVCRRQAIVLILMMMWPRMSALFRFSLNHELPFVVTTSQLIMTILQYALSSRTHVELDWYIVLLLYSTVVLVVESIARLYAVP